MSCTNARRFLPLCKRLTLRQQRRRAHRVLARLSRRATDARRRQRDRLIALQYGAD